jgi:hypothetical protein
MRPKVTSYFIVFSVKKLILQKKIHRRFHDFFIAPLAVFISKMSKTEQKKIVKPLLVFFIFFAFSEV